MTARKYKPWPPGTYTLSLPQNYLKEMARLVDDVTTGWFTPQQVEEGYADYVKARYMHGRMEIAERQIMPWLGTALPKLGVTLEIGCGNGSATVPLAARAEHLFAFDIAADQVIVAQRRCDLLSIQNTSIFNMPVSWINDYLADPLRISATPNTIICYALFEHLLPAERMKLLVGAWKHLDIGGHLVVIETPNRLYPFDWHSSQMPFMDQLPPELTYLWNDFSKRSSIPKTIRVNSIEALATCSVDQLYRFGRGASFHEFYLALGSDAFEVVNASILDRRSLQGWNAEDIASLERQLLAVSPPPHHAFAQPSLDLIIRKTGPSRLTN